MNLPWAEYKLPPPYPCKLAHGCLTALDLLCVVNRYSTLAENVVIRDDLNVIRITLEAYMHAESARLLLMMAGHSMTEGSVTRDP